MTHKEAVETAKKLRDYCHNCKGCEGCLLQDDSGNCYFVVNSEAGYQLPGDWCFFEQEDTQAGVKHGKSILKDNAPSVARRATVQMKSKSSKDK